MTRLIKRYKVLFKKYGLVILGMGTLTFTLVNCSKDDPTPNNRGGNGGDTPQPQKHNVELVYGKDVNTQWENISFDTLNKYNDDKTVDSIFMVPEYPYQFRTYPTQGYKILANHLRERHNINPNKIFGKGELQLRRDAVESHPEIIRFFADTMRYSITYHDMSKSR